MDKDFFVGVFFFRIILLIEGNHIFGRSVKE